MELKKLDTLAAAEKGITFTLLDTDDQETDVKISVVGAGSKAFKKAQETIEQVEMRYAKRGKSVPKDELDELNARLFAKCTTGWEGFTDDGKDIPFSEDKAVEIYTAYPFIATQVIKAIYDIKAMMEGN